MPEIEGPSNVNTRNMWGPSEACGWIDTIPVSFPELAERVLAQARSRQSNSTDSEFERNSPRISTETEVPCCPPSGKTRTILGTGASLAASGLDRIEVRKTKLKKVRVLNIENPRNEATKLQAWTRGFRQPWASHGEGAGVLAFGNAGCR
jgi:hypothetical protein